MGRLRLDAELPADGPESTHVAFWLTKCKHQCVTSVSYASSKPTPNWPAAPTPPAGAPNVLVVLFDDVGFSDFGCYGSEIRTPTIDALAETGLRYSGFHTTAMCSTTRSALLTGRNHHSVGMGCLANFDSGYPGYRGKIAKSAGTLAEMLRPHGYRNYMVGKWHVTYVPETGPTGPFDGWPLGRGFDRYYGFMDAETDQYSPELVRDNSHVQAPGSYETGYHLTEDLATNAIQYLADHRAGKPEAPWLLWFAPGACHAPHQAPTELIDYYANVFSEGWDVVRDRRLAAQKRLGIVPEGTELPDRNDHVQPWTAHPEDHQRLFARLQGAYAAMLDHADQHIARIVRFLEDTGQIDNTIVLVLSDNGASQEGGPLGFVNAMGPFSGIPEGIDEKLARVGDIGGPDTHSNFPWGWAMASNTPLKRYKQNTHGGGIRDPLVISWPKKITAAGQVRPQFCHASDLVPTLLEAIGIEAPPTINGVDQQPLEGVSFASTFGNDGATVETGKSVQYFEMFGHRGVWMDGWKAVAYHAPGTPFEADKWELYHLESDFSEVHDLAVQEPERLARMIEQWWVEAEAHDVLPLDDRFAPRFAENGARVHASRKRYELWAGMGHLPGDVAPDVRSRSYKITAHVDIPDEGAEGVLVAHGDATSGYSLFIQDGHLVHDLNIGGSHQLVRSTRPVPSGRHRLSFHMHRESPEQGTGTLLIDDEAVGSMTTKDYFRLFVSWSGLDIGFDRGTPVSQYQAPFRFTGSLEKVIIDMDDDQDLDHDAAGRIIMSKE